MLKKIFILPISIFFVGCSNSNLNLDSKKLCCEQCLKSENIVKTLIVSPKKVTTKTVKTIPIVEPVKTTSIVEPVKTTPVVEPVKTTPVVEPVKTTPVVEPVKTTPVVEPAPVVNKPNGENTISLKPIPNLIDKKLLTKMENLSEDVISSILEMKNVNIIIHIYSKNTGSQHKIIEELISYFLVETPLLEDEIIIREHFINDDKQEIIIEYK